MAVSPTQSFIRSTHSGWNLQSGGEKRSFNWSRPVPHRQDLCGRCENQGGGFLKIRFQFSGYVEEWKFSIKYNYEIKKYRYCIKPSDVCECVGTKMTSHKDYTKKKELMEMIEKLSIRKQLQEQQNHPGDAYFLSYSIFYTLSSLPLLSLYNRCLWCLLSQSTQDMA